MKVLYVTWACDPEDVSEPGVAAAWVTNLLEAGVDAHVVSVSRNQRDGIVARTFGDRTVREFADFALPSLLRRANAVSKATYLLHFRSRLNREVRRISRERGFDVVHQLNPFGWRFPSSIEGLDCVTVRGPLGGGLANPVGMRAVLREGLPFALARRADQVRCSSSRRLRRSFEQLDCAIVAAPYVADFPTVAVAPRIEVESEHGLSQMPPLSLAIIRDPPVLLYVGRLAPSKGVLLALKALGRLDHDLRWRFVIVGDGPDRRRCEAATRELGLSQRVEFRGWQNHQDVANAYSEASIFVFPSIREPSGGVVVEAMSRGVPVICCNYGGPPHAVGDSGNVVPLGGEEVVVDQLRTSLDRLIRYPADRQRLSRLARQRVEEKYLWPRKAERMRELYEDLIQYRQIQAKR